MSQGSQTINMDTTRVATTSKFKHYVELTKPRITTMVLITVAVAAYVAAPSGSSLLSLFHVIIGTFFIAASGSACNQYLERFTDFMMKRTASRPLPANHLTAPEVAIFGAVTFGFGMSYLLLQVNLLTALLGLLTWILYVILYTPMKTRTSWNTFVGAISGAMPILMGAAGTTATINLQSWLFFAVLFFWQFPHFMAIAWLYRHDYAKSKLVMLTVTDPTGRAAGWVAVWTGLAMYPAGLLLAFNMSGYSQLMFLIATGALCTFYLVPSVGFLRDRSDQNARKLLRVSVMFLPLFMIFLGFCQG